MVPIGIGDERAILHVKQPGAQRKGDIVRDFDHPLHPVLPVVGYLAAELPPINRSGEGRAQELRQPGG
jgi:hypothetical protein